MRLVGHTHPHIQKHLEFADPCTFSEPLVRSAAKPAERMRLVMEELADLSAHKTAAELSRRKIPPRRAGNGTLRGRLVCVEAAPKRCGQVATASGI